MAEVEQVDTARVLIVEDDPGIRRRLGRLVSQLHAGGGLQMLVGSVAEAHQALAGERFGLALVDIGLPDGSGIALIGWLQLHHPTTAALVITSWNDERTVVAALRAGAVGYLLKERDDEELLAALQSVGRGGAPIDPGVARHILAQLAAPAGEAGGAGEVGLTEREAEVLALVAKGYSNREIAHLTALSRFTIEDHTKRIYRKLAVNSRTAAVHEAKALGLLQ